MWRQPEHRCLTAGFLQADLDDPRVNWAYGELTRDDGCLVDLSRFRNSRGLPYPVQVYLNGHSFVAQHLAAQGVRFRKHDNAILAADSVAALRAATAALTPQLIEQRCDYWARRLAPHFSPAERRAANLPGYAFSVAQVEYACDTIFRRQLPLQALFRRLAELGALLGGADRTMTVFGRRIDRHYQGRLMTVLEAANQGHPVRRSYYQTSYVKLYGKSDQRQRDHCLRRGVRQ
ncbi:MAG TPA: hypothetical protein VIR57_01460 [Chloroflexota bacterium]